MFTEKSAQSLQRRMQERAQKTSDRVAKMGETEWENIEDAGPAPCIKCGNLFDAHNIAPRRPSLRHWRHSVGLGQQWTRRSGPLLVWIHGNGRAGLCPGPVLPAIGISRERHGAQPRSR